MQALNSDRRRSPRRVVNCLARIRVGNRPARDCTITDISTGGVRLRVGGFDVPEDFVLLLSGEGVAKQCAYRVAWRYGNEIGASFVGIVSEADETKKVVAQL